ncbi:ATP-binding protein [Rhodoferax bucti]|uniref:hybrid sensor histidine kinase/response regulator n=1 Tax=Rhodoferax bucti TaxID=2576305 RepID=UPI001F0F252C|nr:ATP-binding protein [Rhodoferax bucti]
MGAPAVNFQGIRSRMLLAVIAPIVLVVLTLMGVFWSTRVSDLDDAHTMRNKLMAHQVAMASEYGLFSGNIATLQAITSGLQREADVRSVAIFDSNGQLLAKTGRSHYGELPEAVGAGYIAQQRALGVDVVWESVSSGSVSLDDFYTPQQTVPGAGTVLGYVVLEVTRERLDSRGHETMLVAVLIGLAGLLIGSLLAWRLGEGVIGPVMRVSRTIERIGEGDLTLSSEAQPNDPLYDLQIRLNQMAQRLAWGREELEYRVEAATRELRIKKEEAETATLAKSRFLAAASHDLRQPTHALGMFVARLGQLPLDAQTRQVVGSLEASVHSMQDLLDGLLDVSRLDAGAVQVHRVATPVDELFQGIRKALSPVADGKGLRLRVRPSSQWALTDPVLLQRMVMNLANNALRYTERGTVLVSCRVVDAGTQLRIDVADSGIGISPEHQRDIFREFYQVGNPGRDRAQGLGLGLNIVERTAKLLGHTVALRSGLGCGTRFSITLPRALPREVPVATFHASEPAGFQELEGMRILIVEDDGFALEALRDLLSSWGCVVNAAANVQDALDFINAYPAPDLVLSDFRLGEERNGIDVIEMVRSHARRQIPACLMSGDTDTTLIQAAQFSGLTLLHKPVRPAKLRSLLRRLSKAENQAMDVVDVFSA